MTSSSEPTLNKYRVSHAHMNVDGERGTTTVRGTSIETHSQNGAQASVSIIGDVDGVAQTVFWAPYDAVQHIKLIPDAD